MYPSRILKGTQVNHEEALVECGATPQNFLWNPFVLSRSNVVFSFLEETYPDDKLHTISILLVVKEFRCVLQNHTFNTLQTDGAQVLQWKLWGAPLNKLDNLSSYIHSVSKINVKILV